MPVFRIYTLGLDARFIHAKDIECVDDQEAIQKAQQTVDRRDIELWERGRFIKRLAAKPGTMK
jgi:hypothetical protein